MRRPLITVIAAAFGAALAVVLSMVVFSMSEATFVEDSSVRLRTVSDDRGGRGGGDRGPSPEPTDETSTPRESSNGDDGVRASDGSGPGSGHNTDDRNGGGTPGSDDDLFDDDNSGPGGDDDGSDDNSGPGGGDDDNSGPGGDDDGSDDNSGSGGEDDDSGSGSSGDDSSGSGSGDDSGDD
jgi:hypothetical protein